MMIGRKIMGGRLTLSRRHVNPTETTILLACWCQQKQKRKRCQEDIPIALSIITIKERKIQQHAICLTLDERVESPQRQSDRQK